jgi:hypothetical protein
VTNRRFPFPGAPCGLCRVSQPLHLDFDPARLPLTRTARFPRERRRGNGAGLTAKGAQTCFYNCKRKWGCGMRRIPCGSRRVTRSYLPRREVADGGGSSRPRQLQPAQLRRVSGLRPIRRLTGKPSPLMREVNS